MQVRFFLFLFFCSFVGQLLAQSAAVVNPFDISSRLPRLEISERPNRLVNPFDVVVHRAPGVSKTTLETQLSVEKRTKLFHFPEGNSIGPAFIFGFLIFLLFFFTFAATANRSALLKAWRSFISPNALNLAQRESYGLTGNTPYYLLYGSFMLHAGVFLFLTIQALNTTGRYNNYGVFAICMGTIVVALLLKHSLIQIIRWLFPGLSTELGKYNFLIIIFSCVLGFFLIPFDFLIAFAGNKSWQTFVTLWLLGLTIIFMFYGIVRAFSFGTKYLAGYPLHFLLYLCAAEIAPVILFIKLMT